MTACYTLMLQLATTCSIGWVTITAQWYPYVQTYKKCDDPLSKNSIHAYVATLTYNYNLAYKIC